jgi:hypothetical protein
MKKTLSLVLFAAMGLTTISAQEPMSQVVERGLSRAKSQSLILADALKDQPGALPRTFEPSRIGGKPGKPKFAKEPSLQTIRYDHWV